MFTGIFKKCSFILQMSDMLLLFCASAQVFYAQCMFRIARLSMYHQSIMQINMLLLLCVPQNLCNTGTLFFCNILHD